MSATGAAYQFDETCLGVHDRGQIAPLGNLFGLSNLLHEEEVGTAVGRFHRRALTQQQEPAVYLDLTVQRAPRGVVYTNQGLVELGAYEINKIVDRPVWHFTSGRQFRAFPKTPVRFP